LSYSNSIVIQGTIFWTEIPTKHTKYTATPEERTRVNFDKTTIFEELLEREYKGDLNHFFGELQYAFLLFILAENVEGFEQWKKMVILVCLSDELVRKKPDVHIQFIRKK